MLFIACWAASATPSPPHRANAAPTTRARPLPCRWLPWTVLVMSAPMIGNCAAAEATIRSARSERPWRMNPITVTATSSSGNSEKNP
jgi:hypothetical protein